MENEMTQNEYAEMEQAPRRNKFTTFWLWLMIVGNILNIIGMFVQYAMSEILLKYALGTFIVSIGMSAISIFGVARLLYWKKDGFRIVAGAMMFSVFWLFKDVNFEFAIAGLVGSIVGIGILWGVLQCTKDGVSCWSQLR